MRLLVATITFAVTMGALFLFDTTKTTDTAEKNYAQILEGLSVAESPTTTSKTVAKKAVSKTQAATPVVTVAGQSLIPNTTALAASTPQLTPPFAETSTPYPNESQSQQSAGQAPASTPTPSPTSTPSPQSTGYQIEVVSITSPVKQNSIARLDIKTAPEAQCSIKVTLPSGSQSTAKGLEPKTADSSGAVTWSWRINWNTKLGTATIEVSCAKNSQNFSKTLQMEITE